MTDLTREQQRGILTGDIDRLEKQKVVLGATVQKLADQTNDYYLKRQKAAQEAEAVTLEIQAKEKKLSDQLEDLRQKQRDLDKKDLDLTAKRVKLNDDKELFRKERVVYQEREKDLALKEKDLNRRIDGLQKTERELSDREDIVLIRDKELSKERTDLVKKESDFEKDLKNFSAEKSDFVLLEKRLRQEAGDAVSAKEAAVALLNESTVKLQNEKKSFEKQKTAQEETFRKRELDLIRKEKDLIDKETEIKTRFENVEIKEAGFKEKKKKV